MKKLLLLISLFFISCSDDDQESYYNPIAGSWIYKYNKSDYVILNYTKYFGYYAKSYENGILSSTEPLNYIIDTDSIYISGNTKYKADTLAYKIVLDTLYLTPRTKDEIPLTQKYTRMK